MKEIVELNIETQIAILKRTVLKIRTKGFYGCCGQIRSSICELGIISDYQKTIGDGDLKKLIPSFTRENAMRLAIKKKFKKPSETNDFWWKFGECKEVRIRFLNALIQELKNK